MWTVHDRIILGIGFSQHNWLDPVRREVLAGSDQAMLLTFIGYDPKKRCLGALNCHFVKNASASGAASLTSQDDFFLEGLFSGQR
jgi:hypothetical protein